MEKILSITENHNSETKTQYPTSYFSFLNSRIFTLIELLVIITIISIVITILLPTLGKAREKGRETLCQSNMKQLGSAFGFYINDNQEWCPASYRLVVKTDTSGIQTWYDNLDGNKYISKEITKCPSSAFWSWNANHMNYGLTMATFGSAVSTAIKVTNQALKYPTRQATFLESMPAGTKQYYGSFTTSWSFVTTSYGGPQYNIGSTNATTYSVEYRHRMRQYTNAVMLDGHVAPKYYNQTIYGRSPGICSIFYNWRNAGVWAPCHSNRSLCNF